MASLGTLAVEVNGETHTITIKSIDLVRAEAALQKSVMKMDGMTDLYGIAWAACRRLKLDVPDTFDAFLNTDADVEELDGGGGSEGKGSAPAPGTG